jgi:hypothetical protein
MKRIQIILIVGLIHGLIYTFLMPPWQHYDEPGHFEYAWLIANRLKLPKEGDYDQSMRLAVGKSLLESSFFTEGTQPNLTDPTKPIWTGVSQLVDPPLYYIFEAIPLYFLKRAPVNIQLYSGRMFSLLFLLLTIYSIYKLAQELTPTDHPVQWMAPLFIALLPGFVEFMTSFNDFVAAIGLFSLWMFVAIKMIKGFSLKYLIVLVLLTIACLFTQKVLYIAAPLLFVVFLISIFPRKFKYIAWVAIFVVSCVSFLVAFRWGDAAFWIRANYQDFSERVNINIENTAITALQGKIYPDTGWGNSYPSWNPGFFQLVPPEVQKQVNGKIVTIGAWIWSDQNIQGYGPGVNSLVQFQDRWFGFRQVQLGQNPTFVASVIQLPEQQDRLQVWLRSTSTEAIVGKIYFSGVVMAEGIWPQDSPPKFTNPEGTQGIWGNKPFTNLIRNPQFQMGWPYIKPQIFQIITNKIHDLNPIHFTSFSALFLDIPGTEWYTVATGSAIFRSFWARFGWGQVPLIAFPYFQHPYRLLIMVTILGIVGMILTGRQFVKNNRNEFGFLFVVIGLIFVLAFFYGVYTMGGALRFRAYYPTARYIFPAILPISLILVIGWQGLLAWLNKKTQISSYIGSAIYIIVLAILDLYSLVSVFVYFNKL